jgi:hypothetical protein
MNEIKIEDQKKDFKNWTLPCNSLSQDEFLAGILIAEEGPFCTVQESMENFERWLKSTLTIRLSSLRRLTDMS